MMLQQLAVFVAHQHVPLGRRAAAEPDAPSQRSRARWWHAVLGERGLLSARGPLMAGTHRSAVPADGSQRRGWRDQLTIDHLAQTDSHCSAV